MTRGVPMIDPQVHLKGATPEKLAKALLRQPHLVGRVVQPVVRDEITVEEVSTDEPGDSVPHLVERV